MVLIFSQSLSVIMSQLEDPEDLGSHSQGLSDAMSKRRGPGGLVLRYWALNWKAGGLTCKPYVTFLPQLFSI